MNISEFDYKLPEELIAQMPADKRENSRMMVLNKSHQVAIKPPGGFFVLRSCGRNDKIILNIVVNANGR